jgi:Ca2+-binding EF-hand superfamily protein
MKTLAIVSAATLLVAGLSTTAMAEDFFTTSDGNNDGVISLGEAQGVYNTLSLNLFNSADSDGDGLLDESEFYSLGGLTAGIR